MPNQPNLNEPLEEKPQRKKQNRGNPKPTKSGSASYKLNSKDSSVGGRNGSTEDKARAGRLGGLKVRNQKEASQAAQRARVRRRKEALEEAEKNCEVEKTLPEDLQKQLGITVNPLFQMEQMVISAETSNADKIKLLTKMVEYTHQKTATKQEIKQEVVTHEGVLQAIRDSNQYKTDSGFLEYSEDDDVYVAPAPK